MSTVEASLCEARRGYPKRRGSRQPEDDDYSKMSILQKIVARWLEKPEARGQ
jgi:hypothetical protein